MIYRRAELSDSARLAEFGGRMFYESYAELMDPVELEDYVQSNFTEARQHEILSDPRTTTFLAIADEFAGYAQLIVGSRPGCPTDAATPGELKRIYVERGWHGHGVAQNLLELVETEALSAGCDQLWLAVWEINDRAISFYRKSGFEIIGKQGFPIGHDVHSDNVMAKPLGK